MRRRRSRPAGRRLGRGGVLALALTCAVTAAIAQQPATCQRADFENAVDEASAGLRDMTLANTPVFQAKLRQLKEKRGWSYDQFMTEAAPLVRDEQIASFDQESETLLLRINNLGEAGGAPAAPDCKLLVEVRRTMQALVDTQKSKWAYMFDKIGRELAK